MNLPKIRKTTSAIAAASLALAATCYGNYYSFTMDDFPLGGDFVFEVGDTVEIFTDTISSNPLFTGHVTINGGTLIVTATNGFDPSSYDGGSIFQVFTPGQYTGDFDTVTIFGQQTGKSIGSISYLAQIDVWSVNLFSPNPIMSLEDLQRLYDSMADKEGLIITYYSEDLGEWVTFVPAAVPEPSTYALLLATGIGGIALLRLRRRKA